MWAVFARRNGLLLPKDLMIESWKWWRLTEGNIREFAISCDFTHTLSLSWRHIHRSFHTLFCACNVVCTTDINNTPHDRHIMTAYCYSCLSFAFRFSPFMDISVAYSTYLTPSTHKDVPGKQRVMKERFGLGFLLLDCSKTRTSQLLPLKQIFFFFFHTILLSSKCFSFSLPEDPTTDVITRPISFSFVYMQRVAVFTGSLLFCVSVLQDYSRVDIEYV